MQNDESPTMERFLTQRALADLLHLPRSNMDRMSYVGLIPDPDVVVMTGDPMHRTVGWEPVRAATFAQAAKFRESGLTDSQGKKYGPKQAARVRSLVTRKYSVVTRQYIGATACSRLLDLGHMGAYFRRKRGVFPKADILIGREDFGWVEESIIHYAYRDGSFPAAKAALWARRRTTEFGMSITDGWVQEWAEGDPERLAMLAEADEHLREFGMVRPYPERDKNRKKYDRKPQAATGGEESGA